MKTKIIISLLCLAGLSSIQSHGQISFEKHSIASLGTPFDVCLFDIDQDGFLDVLTGAAANGGEVRWWRNNGNGEFSSFWVATNTSNPRSARAVRCLSAYCLGPSSPAR